MSQLLNKRPKNNPYGIFADHTIHRDLVTQNRQQVAEGAEQDLEQAKAWLAHAEGRDEEAIATLRSLRDKQGQFAQAGDGVPAREMLADLLLEIGQPELALVEYEANLRINPNRFNSLYGAARASEVKGDHTRANSYYSQLVGLCEGSNSSRPELRRARAFLNAPSRGAKELPIKKFAE